MGTLNLNFSKEEIDQLIQKYSLGNGLVCYSKLCDAVDHVFSDAADPMAVIENSKSTANFTDSEKDILTQLLGSIRNDINFKRILIKPQF